MFRNIASAGLALLILSACDYSHSIDMDLISGVKLRPKYGETRVLKEDDPEYQELLRYLESNRDGWRQYDAMIPDAEFAFSSDQFVLYIADDEVFLYEFGEKLLVKNLQEHGFAPDN